MKGFASDNYSGAHPEVLAAMVAANAEHAAAYGADPWTARAQELLRGHFGEQAQSFLVWNGTGANVTILRAMCRPWHAVVCAASAHINVDESGAPEFLTGVKLLDLPTPDGKLTPELVRSAVIRVGDEHAVQAKVISITQSTEMGTLYTAEEIRALADLAHANGMYLHVDGARLANAAAALGLPLRAFTTDVGVDAVSFGGTKNGMVFGEAVVLLAPELAEGFQWIRKQSMQLASKGRFLAAQFVALLEDDLWLRSAQHANAMGARLATAVRDVPGVRLTQEHRANVVFAALDPAVTARLQQDWPFYVWDEATGEVRWMCSWDTTEQEVDAFAAALAGAVAVAA
ncbi:MAG: Threonine aldolase [Solirubrobacterales bacterium]|nr:Threonine aldolase [Solirubrobacterales bacterium]